MENKLQLVVTSDAKFAPYIIPMFKSIIAFNRYPIKLYILTDLGEVDQFSEVIAELKKSSYIDPEVIGIDPEIRTKYEHKEKFHPNLVRCYLSLTNITGKVLYIDIDTLVIGDLMPLYQTDLEGNILGASLDYYVNLRYITDSKTRKRLSNPKYPNDYRYRYVNMGTAVIDCDLHKQEQPYLWLDNLASAYDNQLLEQDMINFINHNQIKIVANKYNFLANHIKPVKNSIIINKLHQSYLATTAHEDDYYPVILHYAGGYKPWHSTANDIDHNQLYLEFAKLSFAEIEALPIAHFKAIVLGWIKQQEIAPYFKDQFAGVLGEGGLTRQQIKQALNSVSDKNLIPPYLFDYRSIKIFAKPMIKLILGSIFKKFKK